MKTFLSLALAIFLGPGGDSPFLPANPSAPAPAPAPPHPIQPEPPATPTGLAVSATTDTTITWTWNPVEGATHYVVRHDLVEAGAGEIFAEGTAVIPPAPEPAYTARGLAPATTVHFRVAAASGPASAPLISDFTARVSAVTDVSHPSRTLANALPDAPTLRVEGTSASSIAFTWTEVEAATGYEFEYAAGSAPTVQIDLRPLDLSHTVSGIQPDTEVRARVRARVRQTDSNLPGEWSAILKVPQTLPAPTLEVESPSPSSVSFTWAEVEHATGYELAYAAGSAPTVHIDLRPLDLSYTVSEIEGGTEVRARLRARLRGMDGIAPGKWSAIRTVTTPPPPSYRIHNLRKHWENYPPGLHLQFDWIALGQPREYWLAVKFHHEGLVSECNTWFSPSAPEETGSVSVSPNRGGCDPENSGHWNSVSIQPADGFGCEGCGTFESALIRDR